MIKYDGRDTFALNQSLEFIRSSLNNLEMASQYECEKGKNEEIKFYWIFY